MLTGQAGIRALIPHAGDMCLLADVTSWDATHIACIAHSHRSAANPLASGGRLGALCGIEYAAQAMAAHGRLTGLIDARPRAGLLVSVRDVVTRVKYLSDFEQELRIEAEQLMAVNGGVTYRFMLYAGAIELMHGRAAVVLDADAAVS